MTPGEFREIAKAMREFGISRAKMGDVEIEAGPVASLKAQEKPAPAQDDLGMQHSSPIEHKVEQLTSLLKLNDTDLVDSLFPDHTETEESA